tara:strand:- start:304 stop:531 length:228 start_codon:yes stop_codon:yes gene_type:complete
LQAKNDMALNGSESGPTALLMVLAVLVHGKIDSPFVHLLLRRLNPQTIFQFKSQTIFICQYMAQNSLLLSLPQKD